MVPAVKDNQSTCTLVSDQINAVLNTDSWSVTPGIKTIKRACSDPDRSDVEMAITVNMKYLVPKKLTEQGYLMIGATQLGSKKGEEVEFVSGLQSRLESREERAQEGGCWQFGRQGPIQG